MDEPNHQTYWEYWGNVGIVEKEIETTIKGLGLLNVVFFFFFAWRPNPLDIHVALGQLYASERM